MLGPSKIAQKVGTFGLSQFDCMRNIVEFQLQMFCCFLKSYWLLVVIGYREVLTLQETAVRLFSYSFLSSRYIHILDIVTTFSHFQDDQTLDIVTTLSHFQDNCILDIVTSLINRPLISPFTQRNPILPDDISNTITCPHKEQLI